METKKCTRCELLKPIDEFSWKSKKLNKKKSRCKTCISEIDKTTYTQNEKRRKQIRQTANERSKFNREFIKRYKKFLKCSKCGDDRWYVIDFHHIRDKEYELSNMTSSGFSIKKLKDEIRKCVPLCSNCHREHHFFESLKNSNENKDS